MRAFLSAAAAYLRAAHRDPTLAVSAFAALLAAAAGAPVVLTTLAVLAGQLSVGWVNDLHDRELDLRAGRTEKPLVRGDVSAVGLRRGIAIASAATALLSILAFGVLGAIAHLIAVASAQSYNLVFKTTVLSWLPYAISFGLLPSAILLGASDPRPWRLAAVGALLGIAGHLINAIKDMEADRLTAVRGLPQRLGVRASTASACVIFLILAFALTTVPWSALLSAAALSLLLIPIKNRFPMLMVLVAFNLLLLLDSLRS